MFSYQVDKPREPKPSWRSSLTTPDFPEDALSLSQLKTKLLFSRGMYIVFDPFLKKPFHCSAIIFSLLEKLILELWFYFDCNACFHIILFNSQSM